MFELLEGWLRHKSDMVNFEAARAICEMKNVNPSKLTRAIAGNRCISHKVYARLFLVTDYLCIPFFQVLQLFLSSPKTILKFASIRTLATLALTHPTSVATCNIDMENLISDPNRSVATYAITTLLKVWDFLFDFFWTCTDVVCRPATKLLWTV